MAWGKSTWCGILLLHREIVVVSVQVRTQKIEQLSDMGRARLLHTETLSNHMQSELHSISPHAVA